MDKTEMVEKTQPSEAPKLASDSDEALESVSSIQDKALLRKIDLHVLPALTLLYLLSFLDRSNGRIAPTTVFSEYSY